MKKLEAFLNSGIYIGIIFLITFVSWSFYQETPPTAFNLYNMIGLFVLILINTMILSLFKNTLYTIPVVISFLFIINQSDISFDSLASLGFPIIAFMTFVVGFVVHWIRFKPKMKQGVFFLGFGLIALSYVIPLIYTPFTTAAIPISLMGTIFFALYIFYSSTLKGNLNYLFKIMMFANILLTAEVFFYLYQGYLLFPDLDFYHRIFQGWQRNLGWANINDMCFYIALTIPGYLYFIFKKPKTYLVWFMMILPVIAVFLSKSRGGMIGFAVVVLGMIIFFILRGNKNHLFHGLVFLIVMTVIAYIGREALYIWWEFLIDSLGENLNDFSSNRIYIYEQGWLIFKQYPLFGGGWMSVQSFPFGGRIFMFHSTFVQALAAMGLFGLGALFVHYFQIGKFMLKDLNLEKSLFLLGYIATQVHGLIDNVQYAVPYSVLIILFLSIFETSEKQTSFELINHRYHLIEEQ